MLVVTRHPGDPIKADIVIGDSIVVSVLSVQRDGRVQIGIKAPDSVAIHRLEVYLDMMEQHGAAGPGGHLAPGRSSTQRPSVSLRGRGEVPAGPAGYDGRRAGRDIGRDSSGVRLGSGRPVAVEDKGRAVDRGGSLGPYGYPEGLGGGGGGEGGGA